LLLFNVNLLHKLHVRIALTVIFAVFPARTEDFHPPAENRLAQVAAAGSILPGGRLLKSFGQFYETGPGPFGLAVSPRGTIVATADIGPERHGVTILEQFDKKPPQLRHIWARTPNSVVAEIADPDWRGVGPACAFDSEKSLWVSEGRSGRLRNLDVGTGESRQVLNLNGGKQTSFIVDLAWIAPRRVLLALDRAKNQLVILDGRRPHLSSSVSTGPAPNALAVSPDGNTAYVAQEGGVSLIDIRDATNPAMVAVVPASSPQALLAVDDRLYASNALDDSIVVISTAERKAIREIPLRIPMLESFRGIAPAGMAYDPVTKFLLVAESGINAVGVVDAGKGELIGHLPVGAMPTRVALSGNRVYVANAEGRGSRPNPRNAIVILGEPPITHPGSVSTFIMPERDEILRQTGYVFAYNGFVPYMKDAPKLPAMQHVVLIVKGNQTFDQVFGDVGGDFGFPGLARFGMHGKALGGKLQFSVQDSPMTPNLHAIGQRWTLSNNFYTTGGTAEESEIAFQGGVPDIARQVAIRVDLEERTEVPDEGTDSQRADRFIREMEDRYVKKGESPPNLIVLHLPGDRPRAANPQAGYPYDASYVAENDYATGRIVAWLSRSPWWRNMTVFITEHDTNGSLDHLNSRRTYLLAAGPWIRKGYNSQLNSDIRGLHRTIDELLGRHPRNLLEATAATIRDIFTTQPDFSPFDALHPDLRVFNPEDSPGQQPN
jgi:DNA-binding beta-propeller fold protein YncE